MEDNVATVTTGFYAAIHEVQSGIELINSLNSAQTNIQMITGMTSKQTQQLTKDYSDLASQLHETTDQIMTASTEFLRAGNSVEDTTKLLQASTVMSKIAGQSQEDSAQSLISIMNAFHLQASDMLHVVDQMVAVDNTSATSTAELSAAIQKVASSAQNAGITLPQLISYIGTISSVTRQSADSIGTAINSVISRYEQVKAGASTDENGESLNNVEKTLNTMGIAIRSSKGQFKDFGTVIDEISNKWSKFNEVQQNEITTVLGGTRQRNYLLTLLNNMNSVFSMQTTEANSAGNALQRYDTYANSTSAHLADLKNSAQKMWMSLINSDVINSFVSGANKIVQSLGFIISNARGAGVALVVLVTSIALIIKNFDNFNFIILKTIPSIITYVSEVGIATAITNGLSAAMGVLQGALSFILSPAGLVVTALAAITVVIVKHIQHEKELKEETDKLTASYKDLTTAINENNIEQEKSASVDVQSEQAKLMKLLEQRKQLENDITETQNQRVQNQQSQQNPYSSLMGGKPGNTSGDNPYNNLMTGQYNANTQQLNNLNSQIKEIDKVITDAGYHIDKTTGKIVELEAAENNINLNKDLDNAKNKVKILENEENQIDSLVSRYNQLTSIQNRNSTQQKELDSVINQLQNSIVGVNVITDANGNKIIKNTDLIHEKQKAIEDEKNAAITAAQAEQEAVKNNTQVTIDGVNLTISALKNKIEAYKADIASYQAETAAFMSSYNGSIYGGIPQIDSKTQEAYNNLSKYQEVLNNIEASFDDLQTNYSSSDSDNYSSTSSSSSTSSNDRVQAEKSADEAISNLRSKLVESLKAKEEELKQKELDRIKKTYDAETKAIEDRKNALQAESDNKDYQEQLSEENSKLQKLKDQMAALSLDNSTGAQVQRNELQDQINDQQKTINDLQRKHNTQAELDNLDDQKSKIEQNYQKQQDDIEAKYKKAEQDATLYAQADKLIQKKSQDEILNLIRSYAPDYAGVGTVLGGSMAQAMIDEINKAMDAITAIKSGNYSAFTDTGKWGTNYVSGGSKSKAVAFDTGGYTGDSEGIAWLDKKEIVMNAFDTSNILQTINTARDLYSNMGYNTPNISNITNSNPSSMHIDNLIKIEGNADKTILPDLNRIANQVISKLNMNLSKTGKNVFPGLC